MRIFQNTLPVPALFVCTLNIDAPNLVMPIAQAQTSPYWWLLVIPGFVILWVSYKRRK